ncbi:MAG: ADP-ribosylglycohydrolase family protein [Clostridia bacterium]|nr:ADP-ribosylglycohydrolase family protein [Clostridia bacterium]
MFGAIIGDFAGSIYEFDQIKNFKPVKVNEIIEENAFFSDDTILTVAIADAAMNDGDYCEKLRNYGKKYKNMLPEVKPYFQTMFSPEFCKWAEGDYVGTRCGNGAMMRISPVAWLFDAEAEVIENARLATIPSHNTQEAIECARLVALTIFHGRKGMKKEDVFKKLGVKITKPNITKFNFTCADTIDLCFFALANADNFEDCIKLAISFGGDTDTNACIVGSMAEAFYEIDEELKLKAKSKLPNEFLPIFEEFENRRNKA